MLDKIKLLFESEYDRQKRELNEIYQQVLQLQALYGIQLQDPVGIAKAIYGGLSSYYEIAGVPMEGKLTLDLLKQDLEWRARVKKEGLQVERPMIYNINGKPSFLIEEIKKRRASNKITLICAIGGLGTGKSMTALKLGWQLDPFFNIDKVLFNPFEIELHLNGVDRPPSVLILDDAQNAISHRASFSLENRYINATISKIRPQKIDLILTTPVLDRIDKNVRELVNFVIKMEPNYIANVQEMKIDEYTGKRSYKWIENLKLELPPEELRIAYEKKRQAYSGGIGFQEMDTSKKIAIAQKLRDKQYSYDKIAEMLKISKSTAYDYCKRKIQKL